MDTMDAQDLLLLLLSLTLRKSWQAIVIVYSFPRASPTFPRVAEHHLGYAGCKPPCVSKTPLEPLRRPAETLAGSVLSEMLLTMSQCDAGEQRRCMRPGTGFKQS